MRELTRNVIRPSVEEVNDRSEFIVNLESIKAGRKITGFAMKRIDLFSILRIILRFQR